MTRRGVRGRLARFFVVVMGFVVVLGAHGIAASSFVGCTFQRSVCDVDEECFNDRLFGNCQSTQQPADRYMYFPDRQQLHLLESEILRLVEAGYTWDSLYTQCVLRNALLSVRQGSQYNALFCDRPATTETSRLQLLRGFLQKYKDLMQQGPNWSETMPLDEPTLVNVHKYLKSHKRVDNNLVDRPSSGLETALIDLQDGRLSSGDINIISDFLTAMSSTIDDDESKERKEEVWRNEMKDNLDPADRQFLSQTTDDASLLTDLLMGRQGVDNLTSDQVQRLTAYINSILSATGENSNDDSLRTESEPDEQVAWSIADKLGPSNDRDPENNLLMENGHFEDFVDSKSEGDVMKKTGIRKAANDLLREGAMKMEQLNDALLNNPQGQSKVGVQVSPSLRIPKKKADQLDVHSFEKSMKPVPTTSPQYDLIDADYVYLQVVPRTISEDDAVNMILQLQQLMHLPLRSFSEISVQDDKINFHADTDKIGFNGTTIANRAKGLSSQLQNTTGYSIVSAGIGHIGIGAHVSLADQLDEKPKYFVLTFILCGVIACTVLVVIVIYTLRRHRLSRDKLAQLTSDGGATTQGTDASKDYQDLCRQHMQSQSGEKPEPIHAATARVRSISNSDTRSPSSHSSTSSWSEEPVTSNMDISTGHIVLSYMEDHLKNKDRLSEEWDALCAYEAEPNSTSVASDQANTHKNRYADILPYDHSRVVLNTATNASGSDYINASSITDHDPRNPAYIATQGPLPHTIADFWQMVWEQGSVVIVNLTKLTENGAPMCQSYWPEEGSELYHIYEVHLVSEHIWCEDFLVRSFYLKNLQTNETRTVTQFHLVTWLDLGVPTSAKVLLDFRRKVNKSYRGRSCPILVHCSDGVGRTGTYCLLDMVLNRMSKGAKEVDIAATLEHIRDQRMQMVKTKEQFEFALAAVAEEVHAILKALPQ